MIKGKIFERDSNKDLTYDNILKKITTYDIFHFYIPHKLVLGHIFSSYLRKDSSPSASVKISKTTGEIYYIDYGHNVTMNAVQYVMAIFNINFNEALQKINNDFGLGLGKGQVNESKYLTIINKYEQPKKETVYKRIDVFTRKPTSEELRYWNLRCIDASELKPENIFTFDRLYLDGKKIPNYSNLLQFAYYFPELDKFKIYTPYANKAKGEYKWISNVPFEYVEGLEHLKKDKPCIIQKSRKDSIILRKFIPEVCNTQSESEVAIPSNIIDYIKENSNKQTIWWDNDATGVRACTYYNQFGYDYINIPKNREKDIDEMVVKNGGLPTLEKFLKEKGLI